MVGIFLYEWHSLIYGFAVHYDINLFAYVYRAIVTWMIHPMA